MSALLIAFRNYADTGVLAGGSWIDTLPLGHLADRQPSRVARSTGIAEVDTVIDLDIGAARPVRLVALIRHSMTQSARWRIRLAADPALTADVVDSGWTDVWPAVFPFGTGAWGEFNWGGKLDSADASTYGLSSYHLFDTVPRRRHVRIELSDVQNPAGYVQAGRLIVAPAWQPSLNMQHGWTIEQVDRSRIVRSRGGQSYVDVARKFRRLRFTLADLGADEMFGSAYELERLRGKGGEVLVMPDPDNLGHRHRHAVYGVLADTTAITNPRHGRFDKEFVVEELI